MTTDGASASTIRRIEIGGMSALELGPPGAPVELVFLHANGFHAALYAELLAPLAAGRRILAPDLRGHGRTTLPADPAALTSWRLFIDDVERALDTLGGAPVTLAGHSLGGSVALLAAVKRLGQVRGLALIEPVVRSPFLHLVMRLGVARRYAARRFPIARGTAARRRRFASRAAALAAYTGRGGFKTWPEEALRVYVEEGFVEAADPEAGVVLRCDPAWEAAIYVALGHDVWGALHDAPSPLVVRGGSQGVTTFPASSERRLRALRPDADVARVEGTTHYLPQERPDAAREAIARMLEGE